jgi:hypothetical protein
MSIGAILVTWSRMHHILDNKLNKARLRAAIRQYGSATTATNASLKGYFASKSQVQDLRNFLASKYHTLDFLGSSLL